MRSSQPASARRAVTRPAALTLLVILAAVLSAALLPRGAQTGVIADLLLTALVLCPLALCLFPVYLLLMFMVVNLQRAHGTAAGSLNRLKGASSALNDRVERTASRWAHRSIRFNAWFAGLDRLLFSVFDRPQRKTDSGKDLNDLP